MLCEQQHKVIAGNLPALRTLLLLGNDGVDRWGEEKIWETILCGVQVVVSTHAVLADALAHGFVKLQQLSLLVFDEGT